MMKIHHLALQLLSVGCCCLNGGRSAAIKQQHYYEDDTRITKEVEGLTTSDGRGRVLTTDIKSHVKCDSPGQQYIVKCSDGTEMECYDELIDEGIEIGHTIHGTMFFSVCVEPSEILALEEYTTYNATSKVNGIELDANRTFAVIPGSYKPVERRLNQGKPYGVDMVRAPEFWLHYGRRGEGVTVCIIDTGLDDDHEDISDTSSDGSNDGDLVYPWFEDGNGHGTHVAGTIAASDNDVGVVGVAPNVNLLIARVFSNDGAFSASSLIDAMNECDLHGSDIISMSLQGPVYLESERLAIKNLVDKGILVIAAAGNFGDDPTNPIQYPAAYEEVLSVAAINIKSELAVFSTYNDGVDIAAPGVNVESLRTGGGTSILSGTSMACPHVSGVAALLMSVFPNEPTHRIRSAMENSAVDIGPCGWDIFFGHGRIDAMAASDYLENIQTGRHLQSSYQCVPVTVNTKTDAQGYETRWYILDEETYEIVSEGESYQGNTEYTDDMYVRNDKCYLYLLLDEKGDGTATGGGSHMLVYDGKEIFLKDDFNGRVFTAKFGLCTTYEGSDTGGAEVTVEVETKTDTHGEETFWYIIDAETMEIVGVGGPYESGGSTREYTEDVTVPEDHCYHYLLLDVWGDGTSPEGSHKLTYDGEEIFFKNDFNSRFFMAKFGSCDGVVEGVVGGSNSEATVCASLDLVTGSNAVSDTSFFLLDWKAADDFDYLWQYKVGDLGNNDNFSENTCGLDPSGCYFFYYENKSGPNIDSGSQVTFYFADEMSLQITANEDGEPWDDTDPFTFYWWHIFVGNCDDAVF